MGIPGYIHPGLLRYALTNPFTNQFLVGYALYALILSKFYLTAYQYICSYTNSAIVIPKFLVAHICLYSKLLPYSFRLHATSTAASCDSVLRHSTRRSRRAESSPTSPRTCFGDADDASSCLGLVHSIRNGYEVNVTKRDGTTWNCSKAR